MASHRAAVAVSGSGSLSPNWLRNRAMSWRSRRAWFSGRRSRSAAAAAGCGGPARRPGDSSGAGSPHRSRSARIPFLPEGTDPPTLRPWSVGYAMRMPRPPKGPGGERGRDRAPRQVEWGPTRTCCGPSGPSSRRARHFVAAARNVTSTREPVRAGAGGADLAVRPPALSRPAISCRRSSASPRSP